MPLVTHNVPNLVNGVSQQADALKFSTQADEQINGMSSIVDGLVKRNPTQHIAKLNGTSLSNSFTHFINRDTSERYVFTIANGSLNVFDINGSAKTLNVLGTSVTSYLTSSTPHDTFRAITVADYTFILNTEKTTAMSADVAATNTVQAVVTVTRGDFSAVYTIKIDSITISVTSGASTSATHAQTTTIAEQLRAALVANGTINAAYDIALYNSSLHIKRKNGADFSLSTSDSGDVSLTKGSMTVAFKAVKTESDLPLFAFHGQKVQITDFSASDDAGYWMEFVAAAGSGVSTGYWKETRAPAEKYKIDASTMPHVLVRLANGQFAVGSCAGHTITVGSGTYTLPTWGERNVGTTISNPEPSFIGHTINDLCFFRSRLGFLAEESVILSETSSFFNFFRTDTTTLLDSDPIDVTSNHTKVSILRHAIPFSDKLVLFSDQTQFYMTAGDILTPKTASIQQTTEFSVARNCRPAIVGKNIFFPFGRGEYSGVMEYYITQDTLEFNGLDVSSSIPSYIEGNITQIAVSSNEQIAAFITDNNDNTIYVYKYFFTANEKLQSAWSKWTFDIDANILGIDFIDNVFYIVVSRPDGVFLEKMDIESGHVDTYSTFTTRLDRRLTDAQVTLSYNSSLNRTTITLPFVVDANDVVQAVTRSTASTTLLGGTVLPRISQSTTQLVVKGNVTSIPLWVGVKYDLVYQPSRPMIRVSSGQGGSKVSINDGRFQVKRGTLSYNNSLYFKVEVTPPFRDTYTYSFTGFNLGTGDSIISSLVLKNGTFDFPIMSKNEGLVVKFINDSPFPSALMTLDWEAFYHNRAQRV